MDLDIQSLRYSFLKSYEHIQHYIHILECKNCRSANWNDLAFHRLVHGNNFHMIWMFDWCHKSNIHFLQHMCHRNDEYNQVYIHSEEYMLQDIWYDLIRLETRDIIYYVTYEMLHMIWYIWYASKCIKSSQILLQQVRSILIHDNCCHMHSTSHWLHTKCNFLTNQSKIWRNYLCWFCA